MKIIADKDNLLLQAENDFDVMALDVWRGRKSCLIMETYKRNEERFGEKARASGWLRIEWATKEVWSFNGQRNLS